MNVWVTGKRLFTKCEKTLCFFPPFSWDLTYSTPHQASAANMAAHTSISTKSNLKKKELSDVP